MQDLGLKGRGCVRANLQDGACDVEAGAFGCAGQSKLANILFAKELAVRYECICCIRLQAIACAIPSDLVKLATLLLTSHLASLNICCCNDLGIEQISVNVLMAELII